MILERITYIQNMEKSSEDEFCNDPTCVLTRKGVQHTHDTDEERKKHRINRKKQALKSLLGFAPDN